MAVWDGKLLKYGPIKGVDHPGIPMKFAASVAIKNAGGKFVDINGSGYMDLAAADSTEVTGWADAPEVTTSLGDEHNVIVSVNTVYRIPINSGTLTQAMIGKTCDLSVSSGIQGAALDASSRDVVTIVDGDIAGNEWVDVVITPSKRGVTGVV